MCNTEPYNVSDDLSSNLLAEPVMAYETPAMVGEPTNLPDDILVGAVRCAETARKEGRMLPNDQIYKLISERLGWK